MDILLILGVLALLVWFWVDTLRAREQAVRTAALACKRMGAQLLDQTVSLQRLRPARNAAGHMVWRRIYSFEFSVAGYERRQGRAFLLGQRLEQLQLEQADGLVIDMEN